MADPWSLETTTAFVPGEDSIAEHTMDYARQIAAGKVKDPQLFFFHRQASDVHDLLTPEGVRAAVLEASGPVAGWSDLRSIEAQWEAPDADHAYLERIWLNKPIQSALQAFSAVRWAELARPEVSVPAKEWITLGFDGSRFHDATAIIGTVMESGHQFVIGIWERDETGDLWEVPRDEVNQAVADAFDRYDVAMFYGDPPDWTAEMADWSGKFGHRDRVQEWWTNRYKTMAFSLRSYRMAMQVGSLTHDGDSAFARHVGNAVRHDLNMWDGDERLWVIRKERTDSPNKIDAAMAGCLSWQARLDVIEDPPRRKTGKASFF
jgi:phage terminase large subunit-like protein